MRKEREKEAFKGRSLLIQVVFGWIATKRLLSKIWDLLEIVTNHKDELESLNLSQIQVNEWRIER